ncbi:MAG: (d)CMP kinase [Nitrospirota bacterium]|nr:(d)CMP kinase [Nitrospirota bacterium]
MIAIDGPSGAGKSTIAKLLADRLGFDYLDTGALYRAVALHLVRSGFDESASDQDILSAFKGTEVAFSDGRVMINGKDVSMDIRSPEAGHYASVFSARKPVRDHLLKIQRNAAETGDLVAEGRDMTTVVFPGACVKFYLDASVDERTGRRTRELISKGFAADEDHIRNDIIARDMRDSGREIAPLKKADDAYVIDSTRLSTNKVLEKMLEFINHGRGITVGGTRENS